jgi:hypothetical protein
MKKASFFLFLFILSITLLACSDNDTGLYDGGSNNNQEESIVYYTLEELLAYDGKNGIKHILQ